VCGFYRNILDDLSSSSQQGSASLGRQLPSLSARRFKPSERYSRRVPASVFTAAIVLFCGISLTFDRKADHPFLATLFLAPVVGGCFVYLLLLFMLLLGASCGAGAAAIGYVGTTYPLVKECVLVAIETKEHEIADRVVDRLARKLEWPRG
jgi:hypothetical protein